jgi:LmbE family N-acetylglucosaminyl deacetylase
VVSVVIVTMTLFDFCKGKRIIFIGAHPDDIELGCGGTLSQLRELKPRCLVISSSSTIPGNSGITKDLDNAMKCYDLEYHLGKFKTRHFVDDQTIIRDLIYQYRNYDVFFTHSIQSQHIDHRIVGQAVIDIIKDKTIFTWEEINTGKDIKVNWWNEISSDDLVAKMRALDCYTTQKRRAYFEGDVIPTLARMRGNEIQKKYAEGFTLVRGMT